MAAMDTRSGANIDDIVGGADRVLVMLDDDHGVADVAQAPERFQQPLIVALMEADRGLVEHVEDARQPGADLAREADALALATRQRSRAAAQREIVETDIVEKAQALADFLEHALADLALLRREPLGHVVEPRRCLADRHVRDIADVEAVDLDRQRLRLQPEAAAGEARLAGHVFF